MYDMRLSNGKDSSRTSKLEVTTKFASILASVIDMKVARTAASFLVICQDICLYNGFYFYDKSM